MMIYGTCEMKQYRLTTTKMKKDELEELLLWFFNLHPFSEKILTHLPENLKKYFEEIPTNEKK